VLQDAVEGAGAVEPGHNREPPGDGGGLEPADLLHPPDVQLEVRPLGERVQAALGAPGQIAAQVRFGVLAGGALEAGQVGSHCQPQLVSERHQGIGRHRGQVAEGHHVLTVLLLTSRSDRAAGLPDSGVPRRRTWIYMGRAFWDILVVKEAAMTKTLIEIDDEYLAAAQQALGTATKKDTVNAALREVTALAARRRDLHRLTSRGLPDLEDEDVMRAAWQR
jgi:Arc/MetJ family transcription regulator